MKKALYIVITLLIGLTGWQIGRLSSQREETDKREKNFYSEYTYPEVFSILNNGSYLLCDSVEDYRKEPIQITDLSDSTDLFVYINPYGCTPCMNMTMTLLSNIIEQKPSTRITILLTDVANRDLLVHTQEYKHKINFYKCLRLPFRSVESQDISSPVLFRLDSLNMVTDCYMTEFNDLAGLKEYLKSITSNNQQ